MRDRKAHWGLRPAQKAERRKWIGASDAGSIVAGGEDWIRLWELKTGRAEPEDLSNELRVMMGLFTEAGNAWWYEQRTGRPVQHRQMLQRHPEIPYLAATLDGVSMTSGGDLAPWDSKHVGRSGEQMELRYQAGGHHQATCLGADWYILSTFVGNARWELTEVQIDPFFLADYLAKCHQFWGYVERDERPPEVHPLPVPAPKRLRIVQLEDEFRDAWPANWGPPMAAHIKTFAETKPAADLHHLTREEIKNLLPDDVGEVRRGLFTLKRDRAGSIRMSIRRGEEDDADA